MGSPAATCRELASRVRSGALATVQRSGGLADAWPFATLVTVAVDERGRPLMLLSRLAEHTKNLEQCARASLLLVDPDGSADPLAAARMTVGGACAPIDDASQRDAARQAFLAAHPDAARTFDFPDFALWRIEVASVRWIAGFGRMGWVDAAEYSAAFGAAFGEGPGGAP
jgi:putative heme iron utilization protein